MLSITDQLLMYSETEPQLVIQVQGVFSSLQETQVRADH